MLNTVNTEFLAWIVIHSKLCIKWSIKTYRFLLEAIRILKITEMRIQEIWQFQYGLIEIVKKERYRDRKSGVSFFDVQPSEVDQNICPSLCRANYRMPHTVCAEDAKYRMLHVKNFKHIFVLQISKKMIFSRSFSAVSVIMMISGWVGLVQSWGFAEHQLPNGGKF